MKKKKLFLILSLFSAVTLSSCSFDDILNKLVPGINEEDISGYKQSILDEFEETYNSIDLDDYDEEEQTELLSLRDECVEKINNETTKSGVDSVLSLYTTSLNEVKTSQEKAQDQQSLIEKIAEAKESLESYYCSFDLDDYDEEEQAELLNIYNDGCDTLDRCNNESSVNTSLNNFKSLLDAVLTSAQKQMSQEDTEYYCSIYAINDFHGAVVENSNEQGILKVASYLKERNEDGNTVLINSGDMFQGSVESNYNHGELLTKIMNEAGFDAFTIGNHEFDWDTSYIRHNRSLGDTAFLGANIYNYNISTHRVGSQASDLCDEYKIVNLENGLKVGIIGVIGEDQITSITSSHVENLTFVDPEPIVKSLSDKLRGEYGCNIIILDAHASVEQMAGSQYNDSYGFTSISNVTDKRYVDVVLCAHSHEYENYLINGVPFVQASCNGRAIANVELSYYKGNVNLVSRTNNDYVPSNQSIDANILNLYNTYKQESDTAGNVVLNTLTGSNLNGYVFSTSKSRNTGGTIPNLACEAIAAYCKANNIDIDYSMCNDARVSSINKGTVTYANLYKALPFDNTIYVFKAKGTDIIKEYNYNAIYSVNTSKIDPNKTYTVAVLDYLATHRDDNRNIDYFKNSITGLNNATIIDSINYRDMTADFIKSLSTFDGNAFSTSYNKRFLLNGASGNNFTIYDYDDDPYYDNYEISDEDNPITPPSIDVTLTSIPDILDEINQLSNNEEKTVNYYVKGTINEITDHTYGNMIIIDNNNKFITIYGSYGMDGKTKFGYLTSEINEYDEVIFKVETLLKYCKNNKVTPEIKNAKIYAVNGVLQDE